MATFAELSEIANNAGQPELVYKLMELSTASAVWNTRKGVAFALAEQASRWPSGSLPQRITAPADHCPSGSLPQRITAFAGHAPPSWRESRYSTAARLMAA